MKKLGVCLLAVWVMLILFHPPCSTFAQSAAKDPYKVGIVISLTGSANVLGVDQKKSVEMAAEIINKQGGVNGHPLEIVINDDKSSPEECVKVVMKQIVKDEVLGMFGGLSSGATLAAMPVAAKYGVPLISCHARPDTTRQGNKWLFRAALSDEIVARGILEFIAKDLKKTKVSVLYDSNAYGVGGYDEVVKGIQGGKYPIKLVSEEKYDNKATDLTAQLTKIRATGPEVLILWGTNPAPAIAMKNAKQLGMKVDIIGSTGVLSPTVMKIAGESSEGVFVVGWGDPNNPLPRQEEYYKAFRAKYGKNPAGFEYLGGDSLMILANALKISGADRNRLQEALETTKDFNWALGPWNYSKTNHDGLDERAIVMLKIVKGEYVGFHALKK